MPLHVWTLTPFAELGAIVLTSALPKTRSGKTLRKTVRKIVEQAAEGQRSTEESLQSVLPPTIDDVSAVHKA